MIRLFVAVKIPSEIKEYLINTCKQIAPEPGNYKWETSSKIHLTVKFIGDVDENLVEDITGELSFIENYGALEFTLTGFGFYFRNKDPKILWAGLETHKSIYNLVAELNQRFSKYFIPVDNRKFKPHLTMLRIKNDPGTDFIKMFKQYSFNNFKFISNEITLVQSRLLQAGSQYTDIKKYNLK
jgi:2'-5' RNA ligase